MCQSFSPTPFESYSSNATGTNNGTHLDGQNNQKIVPSKLQAVFLMTSI